MLARRAISSLPRGDRPLARHSADRNDVIGMRVEYGASPLGEVARPSVSILLGRRPWCTVSLEHGTVEFHIGRDSTAIDAQHEK